MKANQNLAWTSEGFATRYDLVIHLVTAADGASAFYTTRNNSARSENISQALALDAKTRECWSVHSNVQVILPFFTLLAISMPDLPCKLKLVFVLVHYFLMQVIDNSTGWKKKSEKTKHAWPQNAKPKMLREPE